MTDFVLLISVYLMGCVISVIIGCLMALRKTKYLKLSDLLIAFFASWLLILIASIFGMVSLFENIKEAIKKKDFVIIDLRKRRSKK